MHPGRRIILTECHMIQARICFMVQPTSEYEDWNGGTSRCFNVPPYWLSHQVIVAAARGVVVIVVILAACYFCCCGGDGGDRNVAGCFGAVCLLWFLLLCNGAGVAAVIVIGIAPDGCCVSLGAFLLLLLAVDADVVVEQVLMLVMMLAIHICYYCFSCRCLSRDCS